MQYPQNQSCCGSNPVVNGWSYCGCGNQYPVVPGTNPALQTWNGQNFVVADGSYQNPISLPFLKTTQGGATYFVGADNNGNWSYYNPTNVTNANNLEVTATGSTTPRTLANRFADVVNVLDYGADPTGLTNSTSAFTAAYNAVVANSLIVIPKGTYICGTITGTKNVWWECWGVSSTGNPFNLAGIVDYKTFQGRELTLRSQCKSTDYATHEYQRYANYNGGNGGNTGSVSSNLITTTVVSNGANNNEWGITSQLQNSATGSGENVAIYAQSIGEVSGASPLWGMVTEARDVSSQINPTNPLIGIEVDVFANGTDNNNQRVGILCVVGKGVSGTACMAYAGIDIGPVNNDPAQGSFVNGIIVTSGNNAGIEIVNTGAYGISILGTNIVGVDFSQGTFSQAAVRFARNQKIAFEQTATLEMDLASGANIIQFTSSGTEIIGLNLTPAAPSYRINSLSVVGPRVTGWGTATNGSQSAFNGSTATLAQTSAAVAGIIQALTAHGLIGT